MARKQKGPVVALLRVARANYTAAVGRGDAKAARKWSEEVDRLTAKAKALAGVPGTYDDIDEQVQKRRRTAVAKGLKKFRKKSRVVSDGPSRPAWLDKPPADRELEEIRYLKGLLNSPEGEMRSGALLKLQSLLTADELADVLIAPRPESIVRVEDGTDPRQEAHQSHVANMIKAATDRSAPVEDRAAAMDWLTRATAGDPKASDALARVIADGGAR